MIKSNNLKILIPTCDQYIHLIEGLQYTIKKFYPNHGEVIIIGYEKPKFQLSDNFTFISFGKQNGPRDWSRDLSSYLNTIDEEFIMYFSDDSLMTRSADIKQIYELYKIIKNENSIGKIHLIGSLTKGYGSYVETKDYLNNVVEITQTSSYRTSLQPAIWRKSYLLSNLKIGMTPWEFELKMPKNDNVRILSTKNNHPMMFSHLFRKGGIVNNTWYKSMVFEESQLPQEDITIIRKMLKLP